MYGLTRQSQSGSLTPKGEENLFMSVRFFIELVLRLL